MPLRGVGRPGRYNQMAVVCTAHNDGRGCVPYLPHPPAAAPRPQDDFGAAALCVTDCGPRGPLPKQTVLQMRKFMKRRHSLSDCFLSVGRVPHTAGLPMQKGSTRCVCPHQTSQWTSQRALLRYAQRNPQPFAPLFHGNTHTYPHCPPSYPQPAHKRRWEARKRRCVGALSVSKKPISK